MPPSYGQTLSPPEVGRSRRGPQPPSGRPGLPAIVIPTGPSNAATGSKGAYPSTSPRSAHGRSKSFSHFAAPDAGSTSYGHSRTPSSAPRPLPPTPSPPSRSSTLPALPSASSSSSSSSASSSTSSSAPVIRPLPPTPPPAGHLTRSASTPSVASLPSPVSRKTPRTSGASLAPPSRRTPQLKHYSEQLDIMSDTDSTLEFHKSPRDSRQSNWRQSTMSVVSMDSLDLALASPTEEVLHSRKLKRIVKLTRHLGECPPAEIVYGDDLDPNFLEEIVEEVEKETHQKPEWIFMRKGQGKKGAIRLDQIFEEDEEQRDRLPSLAGPSSASSSSSSLGRPHTPRMEPPVHQNKRVGWVKEIGKKKQVVEVENIGSVIQALRTL